MIITATFWDYNVWSILLVLGVLLLAMAVANVLRRTIKPLRKTLLPTSVLAGILVLLFTTIYKIVTKDNFFELPVFGTSDALTGQRFLELLTYHCLGIGFVAMALRSLNKKFGKKETKDIFNSGCLTVGTYLLQGTLGMIISILFVIGGSVLTFKSAGLLLPFGFGQGTGQAFNYGTIYEGEGFVGGATFGLTIAALGFLCATIGGVIYMNIVRNHGKLKNREKEITEKVLSNYAVPEEIDETGSVDKMTIQIVIVILTYIVSYLLMVLLGNLIPSFKSVIFGFNFLLGTLLAVLVKAVFNLLKKHNIMHHKYISNYFMNRIGGFAFDIMIVSGIAAIQIDLIKDYWVILLIMALVGTAATIVYVKVVCRKMFPEYEHEEFVAMYGMLTGTASTGTILLREIDPNFETPASNNLVFQVLPAIVFGFPMMLIATYAPLSDKATYISLGLLILFFVIMNLILFRSFIFKFKKKEKIQQ